MEAAEKCQILVERLLAWLGAVELDERLRLRKAPGREVMVLEVMIPGGLGIVGGEDHHVLTRIAAAGADEVSP